MIALVRKYPYLVRDTDRHGNVRWYIRRAGQPKIRLEGGPESPGFDILYRDAIHGRATPAAEPKTPAPVPAAPGSVAKLIEDYYASAEYKALHPRTRHVRKLVLDRFRTVHGDKRARMLERRHALDIRNDLADRPEAANSVVKYLRAVWDNGIDRGELTANPFREIKYLASNNPGGFKQWSLEEIEKYESHWQVGTIQRLALALLLYTGQRRSDIVRMGRQHVRDGWLTITQTKNARRRPVTVSIPIITELARIMAATPTAGRLTFLESGRGKPFSVEGFGNMFRRWAQAAGLEGRSPHGLRKAASARLAELGCTPSELMAIMGWSTLKEANRYTQGANRKIMAASAMRKLDADVERLSHHDDGVEKWDRTTG